MMHKATVIEDGDIQSIVLPPEYRVTGDSVYLKKCPEGFAVITRDPWELFFEGVDALSDDFMEKGRQQPPLD